MEQQDNTSEDVQQALHSREELEQYLRARAWKDDTFRQELLANPKAVFQREFAAWFPEGKIPSELSITVIEEEEQSLCFVLPTKAPEDVLHDEEVIEDEELSVMGRGPQSYSWGTCYTCHASETCYTCTCNDKCKKAFSFVRGIRL